MEYYTKQTKKEGDEKRIRMKEKSATYKELETHSPEMKGLEESSSFLIDPAFSIDKSEYFGPYSNEEQIPVK